MVEVAGRGVSPDVLFQRTGRFERARRTEDLFDGDYPRQLPFRDKTEPSSGSPHRAYHPMRGRCARSASPAPPCLYCSLSLTLHCTSSRHRRLHNARWSTSYRRRDSGEALPSNRADPGRASSPCTSVGFQRHVLVPSGQLGVPSRAGKCKRDSLSC